MSIQTWFNITVVVFTVSGLMAGGLECDLKEALKWLRSPKLLVPMHPLELGGRAGPGLADQPGSAAIAGTCCRTDVVQSGPDRAVPAAGGDESPRRHDLQRQPMSCWGPSSRSC